MSDDFWGGMFDFNGDGKTTWDEEMIGLAMIEDDIKRSKENLSSTPSYKIKEPKTVPMIKPVPEVVDFGTRLLRIISPFYLVYCVHDTLGGALRGAGNGKVPMLVTLCCFVGFRQLYLYVMANYICNEAIPIAMAFPAGWVLSAIIVLIYFTRTKLTQTKLV